MSAPPTTAASATASKPATSTPTAASAQAPPSTTAAPPGVARPVTRTTAQAPPTAVTRSVVSSASSVSTSAASSSYVPRTMHTHVHPSAQGPQSSLAAAKRKADDVPTPAKQVAMMSGPMGGPMKSPSVVATSTTATTMNRAPISAASSNMTPHFRPAMSTLPGRGPTYRSTYPATSYTTSSVPSMGPRPMMSTRPGIRPPMSSTSMGMRPPMHSTTSMHPPPTAGPPRPSSQSSVRPGMNRSPPASSSNNSDKTTENPPLTKADKRAHHNALERKRRDHIKDSFTMLRECVPSLNGEKVSRAQILNKATDFIQFMRSRNSMHQAELEDLKRQNSALQMQYQTSKKQPSTSGGSSGASSGDGSTEQSPNATATSNA